MSWMTSLFTVVDRPWNQRFRTMTVVQRAHKVGLKLNKDKFMLRQTEFKYMGNILTADGIRPDPDKVTAITDRRRPENVKAVQRFI